MIRTIYANKFNNVDERAKSFQRYKLSKLTQKERNILRSTIAIKEIELVVKKPHKENSRPR